VGDADDVALSRLLLVLLLPKIDFTDKDISDILAVHDGFYMNPVDTIRLEMIKARLKDRLGPEFPHALHAAQQQVHGSGSWLDDRTHPSRPSCSDKKCPAYSQ